MNNEFKEPHIGKVVKSLRTKQGLSLRDLAAKSGLSLNAISKIETGESSPTVASLHKLATALRVEIAEFFTTKKSNSAVFVKSKDTVVLHSNGITIESLGVGLAHQRLDPYKMIVSSPISEVSELVSHSGDEFVYCLKGKLEFSVGEQTFILEPDDKLLFKANQPHRWRNMSNEPAEVIIILEINRDEPLPHKVH